MMNTETTYYMTDEARSTEEMIVTMALASSTLAEIIIVLVHKVKYQLGFLMRF